MNDTRKTKQQLLTELEDLRTQLGQLQAWKAEYESRESSWRREERKSQEDQYPGAARWESERRYRHMVEYSLGLICIHDFNGALLYVNPAAAQRLNYPPDAWIGKNLRDFLAPAFQALFAEYLARIRQQRTDQGLMQVVTSAGEKRIWSYHNVWYEEGGRPLYVLGCAQDVTEEVRLTKALQKAHDELERRVQERTAELARANEALRDSEERYRGIFENANDIIATFSTDGVITRINRAAEITLGWSKEELIGQNYRRFVTPASTVVVEERKRQFFLGAKLYSNMEIEAYRKGGGTVFFECRVRPIRDQKGSPVGFQIVYRDITARKQAEENLRRAKEAAEAANQEKSEFLSTMSHELRTPLQVVLGYADLLLNEDYGVLEERQSEILRRIDKNARDLFNLINGVLDFNRLEAGRMPMELAEVNVANMLREVEGETQGVREFSGLHFLWHVEEDLPRVKTDAGKLKVVVKNLLDNAIKFTKKGSVRITALRQDDGVIISVADTGIGIPPERQALIFEAFQKAEKETGERYDGFGLGLHIVKRLVHLLGGIITVESEVGQGSTFRVWVPVEQRTEMAREPGQGPTPVR